MSKCYLKHFYLASMGQLGAPGVSPNNEDCGNCAAFEPPGTGDAPLATRLNAREIHLRAAAVAEQNQSLMLVSDKRAQLF